MEKIVFFLLEFHLLILSPKFERFNCLELLVTSAKNSKTDEVKYEKLKEKIISKICR